MFGKPDWFRPKTIGWGLTPVRWQGWAYSAAWMGVICVPFVWLVLRGQNGESMAWLAVTIGALIYDVRGILQQIRRGNSDESPILATAVGGADKDVLYIGDSEGGRQSVATRNYSLKLK